MAYEVANAAAASCGVNLSKPAFSDCLFHTNAMTMAFNEGNRNNGNRVLELVHRVCPELYPVMVREANEQRNPDDE